MEKIMIAPSLLSVDIGNIQRDIELLENSVDLFHVDVMDGHFVPNISFGVPVVQGIRALTAVPLDVHLMIDNPSRFIEPFAKAGSNILTIHAEAPDDIGACLKYIRQLGLKSGLALNPDTPPSRIEPFLEDVDMVLQMTVFPGFGGQAMVEQAISNIAVLRSMIGDIDLEVDGGITAENVRRLTDAGANVIVSGSGIFRQRDLAHAAEDLRRAARGGVLA